MPRKFGRQRDRDPCPKLQTPLRQLDLKQVHLGRADKARDKGVGRPVIHFERRADLLHLAIAHDDDAVGQRHRLDLIMGDVKHRLAHPALQQGDFLAHAGAQLGVKVRQRLIQQKHRRIADQRPAKRDALHLPARQLTGLTIQQMGDVQHLGGGVDPANDLVGRGAAHLEAKGHVGADRLVRIKRIVLEHHGDVAVLGFQRGHIAPADHQRAAADPFKSGDHAQRRRFAAARRPQQNDQLAGRDLKVDALDRDDLPIHLAQFAQTDLCHYFPSLTARTIW